MAQDDLRRALNSGFHLELVYKNHNPIRDEPKGTLSSLELEHSKKPDELTLRSIRTKFGSAIDKKWSFCVSSRSIIADDKTLGYYIRLVPVTIEALLAPLKSNSEAPLPPQPGEEYANLQPSTAPKVSATPVITLYLATADSFAPTTVQHYSDPWMEKNPLQLGFNTNRSFNSAAPSTPVAHSTEYVGAEAWTSETSQNKDQTGMLDVVFDLPTEGWRKLVLMNKALSAYNIRGKTLQVTYARHAVFKLKDVGVTDQDTGSLLPPYVELYDNPSIEISEVKSDFQSSLINNAFSAHSFEYMSGGTIDVFSASTQVGFGMEKTSSTASSEGRAKREYHASYNFPRVRLYLDETTMDITSRCKAHLVEIQKNERIGDLISFQSQYGLIFSREILLGGRLDATKQAHSAFDADQNSVQDSFKAQIAVSFSAAGLFSAGAKGSTEAQNGETRSSNNVSTESRLSWTARGGDTLLCANPPAWAGTVSIWKNWRVILQEEVIPLPELLGRYEEFKWVPDTFRRILIAAKLVAPTPAIGIGPELNSSKKWSGKTKIRLLLGDLCLCAENTSTVFTLVKRTDVNDEDQLSTFSVRNAVLSAKGGILQDNLLADYPLYLVLGSAPELLGDDFFDASFVDDDGEFCKQGKAGRRARFSLRHVGAGGKWSPESRKPVANGAKAKLYCHALTSEPFALLESPPKKADVCVYNPNTLKMCFSTRRNVRSSISGFSEAEFTIEFV